MSNTTDQPRIRKRDLARFDERNPGPYTPDPVHIRDVDPAGAETRWVHDLQVDQRIGAGHSAYPSDSIGRWVEPAERHALTGEDD